MEYIENSNNIVTIGYLENYNKNLCNEIVKMMTRQNEQMASIIGVGGNEFVSQDDGELTLHFKQEAIGTLPDAVLTASSNAIALEKNTTINGNLNIGSSGDNHNVNINGNVVITRTTDIYDSLNIAQDCKITGMTFADGGLVAQNIYGGGDVKNININATKNIIYKNNSEDCIFLTKVNNEHTVNRVPTKNSLNVWVEKEMNNENHPIISPFISISSMHNDKAINQLNIGDASNSNNTLIINRPIINGAEINAGGSNSVYLSNCTIRNNLTFENNPNAHVTDSGVFNNVTINQATLNNCNINGSEEIFYINITATTSLDPNVIEYSLDDSNITYAYLKNLNDNANKKLIARITYNLQNYTSLAYYDNYTFQENDPGIYIVIDGHSCSKALIFSNTVGDVGLNTKNILIGEYTDNTDPLNPVQRTAFNVTTEHYYQLGFYNSTPLYWTDREINEQVVDICTDNITIKQKASPTTAFPNRTALYANFPIMNIEFTINDLTNITTTSEIVVNCIESSHTYTTSYSSGWNSDYDDAINEIVDKINGGFLAQIKINNLYITQNCYIDGNRNKLVVYFYKNNLNTLEFDIPIS